MTIVGLSELPQFADAVPKVASAWEGGGYLNCTARERLAARRNWARRGRGVLRKPDHDTSGHGNACLLYTSDAADE